MDLAILVKTADFAAKKHRDQRRKDPTETPYINHPIGNNSQIYSQLDFNENAQYQSLKVSPTY